MITIKKPSTCSCNNCGMINCKCGGDFQDDDLLKPFSQADFVKNDPKFDPDAVY